MDYIAPGVLVGEVEKMYCACGVRNVDGDVAYLSQTMRSLVEPHEL